MVTLKTAYRRSDGPLVRRCALPSVVFSGSPSATIGSRAIWRGSYSGPHLYQDSEIPHAFTEEQIRKILQCARQDRTPAGRRDYAMLLLFATYGLRAGEVLHLRLDDIDWKEERIRIRHTKTYNETFVPLVAPVGAAIFAYLKNGRPKTESRHVFVRAQAPYQPLRHGAVRSIIHRRLKKAGITVIGHQGAHAFRYARARSLLGASVPRSVIRSIFGHQVVPVPTVYLKLVTNDLRFDRSLDLPSEIRKCQPGPTKKKRSKRSS